MLRLRQSGAARKGVAGVLCTAATAKFQETGGAVHGSVDGVQAAASGSAVGDRSRRSSVEPTQRLVPARILDVHVKPHTRSMSRFEIEVEGTHNYFADGVMVHITC